MGFKVFSFKSFLFLSLVKCGMFADDSFITKQEYVKMLYKNPRGIGCDKCHGEKGNGTIIAKYKEKGKTKELKAPKINHLSKKDFFMAFNKKHKIMPKYFLTYQEVESLFYYLSLLKEQQKK